MDSFMSEPQTLWEWFRDNALNIGVIVCIIILLYIIFSPKPKPDQLLSVYRNVLSQVKKECTTCDVRIKSYREQLRDAGYVWLDNMPQELRFPIEGTYNVHEQPYFIDPPFCKQLINSAQRVLVPSKVYYDHYHSRQSSARKSHNATFTDQWTQEISRKVSEWTRIPIEYQEPVQIIKYEEGGSFDLHHDTEPDKKHLPSWSRMITVMIYLNKPEKGGETEFPQIDTVIEPEIGKAVLFWSVRPQLGKPELMKESLHTGKPVEKGEKWICNVWIHSIPFVLDARYR